MLPVLNGVDGVDGLIWFGLWKAADGGTVGDDLPACASPLCMAPAITHAGAPAERAEVGGDVAGRPREQSGEADRAVDDARAGARRQRRVERREELGQLARERLGLALGRGRRRVGGKRIEEAEERRRCEGSEERGHGAGCRLWSVSGQQHRGSSGAQ